MLTGFSSIRVLKGGKDGSYESYIVTIPKDIVKDSKFSFDKGDTVFVTLSEDGQQLFIQKIIKTQQKT